MSTLNSLPFILFLFSVHYVATEYVEIETKYGKVSGLTGKTWYNEKDYFGFRGVPYAKPPVGELRFKPPVPVESWEGTLEAHKNKRTCYQLNVRTRLGEPFGVSGTEDCLYLSIFTPTLDKSLPVVVFDYNDEFRTGFNGTATYSPEFLVEEDVLVVTVNHRLGLFGYLTTGDDVIPGNNGIRDFILALQWIKDNIHQFGGDPTRVTLMGSRGGAALVEMLLYSEKATGLFSAAIIQGGSVMQSAYFADNPKQKAFQFGEVFGIQTEDSETLLKGLLELDAVALVEKEHHVLDGALQEENYQRYVYPFTPVIEPEGPNAILSKLPEETNVVNDVPILAGYNSREGLDHISPYLYDPKLIKEMKDFPFYFPIRQKHRFNKNSTLYNKAIQNIKKLYLGEDNLNFHNTFEFSEYYGDIMQTYAEYFSIRKLAKEVTSPIYFYLFDFRGALNENSESIAKKSRIPLGYSGATVADENCYLFVCSRIRKKYKELRELVSQQPEFKVLEKTVRMWSNFIKTGNPTPVNDPLLKGFKWQPVEINKQPSEIETEELWYLHITKKLTMSFNPFFRRVQFWDKFLRHHGALAKDGLIQEEVLIRDEL